MKDEPPLLTELIETRETINVSTIAVIHYFS